MSPLYMLAIGDSKTIGYQCCVATGGFQEALIDGLQAVDLTPYDAAQFSGVYAFGGAKTSDIRAGIDAFLASQVEVEQVPSWVLINLGSNDFYWVRAGSLLQATWEADMGYILDAIHAKYPAAQIRLMRAVWTGEEVGSTAINDVWMPNVLASRAAWAAVGPDERVFLAGHLADVTHPDATGYQLTAAEWQTAMGY